MSGEGVYHNQEPHKRLLAWQRSIDFCCCRLRADQEIAEGRGIRIKVSIAKSSSVSSFQYFRRPNPKVEE